ncbi:MAG: sulfotransferase, partial [Bacteroidales bacterium]|nr:sulfotransferase [Bacteroidales bacterium]
ENKSLIREIYLSGRESYLRYAYKCSRRIIETNNYITFFAPVLRELFPRAKFVHIQRHPGDFVRSGINRNYYTGSGSDDIKRIVPVSGSEKAQWESYPQIQKISWLWRETNQFIEEFKQDLDAENFMTINFNALDVDKVHALTRFLEADVRPSFIRKKLSKRVNVQKTTIKEPFSQWKEEEKRQVDQIAGDLARQYGYKI